MNNRSIRSIRSTRSTAKALVVIAALAMLTACAPDTPVADGALAEAPVKCHATDSTGSNIPRHDCVNKDHVDSLNGQAVLDSVNSHYAPVTTPGGH
jgi:uncharacterized lipoprotein YajG